jgi:hypothetical protein
MLHQKHQQKGFTLKFWAQTITIAMFSWMTQLMNTLEKMATQEVGND